MSPAKRIFLNAAATYAQSLIRLFIGLFSMRWVLQALGQEDFGLYCVVGSLITFIVFINEILGGSNARYYAYSIGEGKNRTPEAAREDLMRWFNTALSVHLIVPSILLLVGYPIAEYAIHHWINIPTARIDACAWVFRIAAVSAFVNMSSIPFLSMYTAKQYIAVRSGFGIAASVLNFLFALSMHYVPVDKLIYYALYMMVINAGLPVAQILLAIKCFPECRLHLAYWGDLRRLRSLLSYAGWVAFGGGGGFMVGSQGSVFVTNHYFGAAINSSYGIAGQLSAHTQTLSNALMSALSPAVTTQEGSGDRAGTIRLAFRTGKFGVFLILLFAIPMALEMKNLLMLWLGKIPDFVVPVCILTLVVAIIEKSTLGHQMAIHATGKVAWWQFTGGIINALVFPAAWFFAFVGIGPVSAAIAWICCPMCTFVLNLHFARRLVEMPIRRYVIKVLLPLIFTAAMAIAAGMVSTISLPMTWWRIVITTFVSLGIIFLCAWKFVLDAEEREFVIKKIRSLSSVIGFYSFITP